MGVPSCVRYRISRPWQGLSEVFRHFSGYQFAMSVQIATAVSLHQTGCGIAGLHELIFGRLDKKQQCFSICGNRFSRGTKVA
jgi:hypothetical protein